jgi:hypothetical protein
MTYNNVMTNLMSEDRAAAMRVMHDDAAFDKWMEDFDRKRQSDSTSAPDKPGRVRVSKEEFLAKMGGTYGGT